MTTNLSPGVQVQLQSSSNPNLKLLRDFSDPFFFIFDPKKEEGTNNVKIQVERIKFGQMGF